MTAKRKKNNEMEVELRKLNQDIENLKTLVSELQSRFDSEDTEEAERRKRWIDDRNEQWERLLSWDGKRPKKGEQPE